MRIRGELLVNAMSGMQIMVVGANEKTVWKDGVPTDEKELQALCYIYNPNAMEPSEVRISLENTNENKKKIMDNIGQLIGTVGDLIGLDVDNCTTYSGKMQTEYIKLIAKGL